MTTSKSLLNDLETLTGKIVTIKLDAITETYTGLINNDDEYLKIGNHKIVEVDNSQYEAENELFLRLGGAALRIVHVVSSEEEETTNKIVKKIYSEKYDKIEKTLKKVARRAKKANLEFSYSFSSEKTEIIDAGYKYFDATLREYVDAKAVLTYKELTFSEIKWKNETHSLVRIIDNKEGITQHVEKVEYTERENMCDHCNTKRSRNTIYVLRQNDTDELIQVGKNCMSEYLSLDSLRQIEAATWCNFYMNEESEFDCDRTPYIEEAFDVDLILRIACHFTMKNGYKKSDEEFSTKDEVKYFLSRLTNVRMTEEERAELEAEFSEIDLITERAAASKIAFAAKEADSAFALTVNEIFEKGAITEKYVGYLACIPYLYIKQLESEKQLKEKQKSNHIGEIKERLDLTVQITSSRSFDSQFGTSYLYIMKDEAGNELKTFTGRYFAEQDKFMKIKATVKSHDEYKGIKCTMLTRMKILEIIE